MDWPRISVIVPSYNQGMFLEETLLSVIGQEYPNLELIVVDGDSTDNSVETIRKYQAKINWWISEKDSGQSNAINKGFRKVTGEIITWLNSDDLLLDDSLQQVASTFSSAPENTGLIHGGAIVFESNKKEDTRFTYQVPSREAYLSGMVFPQPAAFFRKNLIDMVGILNEELHYGMDYDLFQRSSLVSDFLSIDKTLAKYRLHQHSKSVAESNRFMLDWNRSFVNLCKNLQWDKELAYLQRTGLFNDALKYFKSYSFQPDPKIVSKVNREKTLFFHLGHMLKDLYWTYRSQEAKELKKMMKADFDDDWWQEDSRLRVVSEKLRLPDLALRILRGLKDNRK